MVTIPLLVLVPSCTIFVSGTHLPRRKKRFKREGFSRCEEKKTDKHTEFVKRRKEGEEVSTSVMPCPRERRLTHALLLCVAVFVVIVCLLCSSDSTLYIF